MINKPSLLDTPNLINWKEYTPSDIPGSFVDYCYGNDSSIRQNYDGTDTAEWNTGKQIQETLPAAEWDAFIHDLGAFGWQMTEITRSIWEELYSAIHGQQTGMSHELLDAIETSRFNARSIAWVTYGATTFAEITSLIASGKCVMLRNDNNTFILTSQDANPPTKYYFTSLTRNNQGGQKTVDNTDTWETAYKTLVDINTAQTLTNKIISFDNNTLQNVASLNTAQTFTNKTIDKKDNVIKATGVTPEPVIEGGSYVTRINPVSEQNYVIPDKADYIIGDGPYVGYVLEITVIYVNGSAGGGQVAGYATLNFTGPNGAEQKLVSVGKHHLTWMSRYNEITLTTEYYWDYDELSGTYTDNTTFSYLL